VPRVAGVRHPGAPSAVRATTASLHVDVTWRAARGAVSQYVIRRNGVIVATVSAGTHTWRDVQPTPGRTNVYTVAAQNSAGVGRGASGKVYVPAVPQPPSTVHAKTGWNEVTVSWSSESGVDRWIVLRDGMAVATLPVSSTQYVDDVSVAYGHAYEIVATNVSGASSPSAPADSGTVEWLLSD
jgi:hypothetical protein